MPIQIKNSEIIKQKKKQNKKRNQILGYFLSWRLKEIAPE